MIWIDLFIILSTQSSDHWPVFSMVIYMNWCDLWQLLSLWWKGLVIFIDFIGHSSCKSNIQNRGFEVDGETKSETSLRLKINQTHQSKVFSETCSQGLSETWGLCNQTWHGAGMRSLEQMDIINQGMTSCFKNTVILEQDKDIYSTKHTIFGQTWSPRPDMTSCFKNTVILEQDKINIVQNTLSLV